jgi:hypothetical protein
MSIIISPENTWDLDDEACFETCAMPFPMIIDQITFGDAAIISVGSLLSKP